MTESLRDVTSYMCEGEEEEEEEEFITSGNWRGGRKRQSEKQRERDSVRETDSETETALSVVTPLLRVCGMLCG